MDAARQMSALWLALYFPALALEVFASRRDGSVVVEHDRIVAADATAQQAGIGLDMRLASAWGLWPELAVYERDPAAEKRALEVLACWAGSFTPQVSLVRPAVLLLEVGGCLGLFGGAARLREKAQAGCAEQGFSVLAASAPVPLAAEWLARACPGIDCVDPQAFAAVLSRMKLTPIYRDPAQTRLFAAWGMRSFGDLLRQPRDGLARRLGSDFVLQLAQALGEVADPRPPFRFPERFEQRLELTVPVEEGPALLFGARRLVAALAGWLAARSAAMRECRLLLEHRSRPASVVDTGFAEPVCHPQRIIQVLRERLERYALPAPVEAMVLWVERTEHLPAVNGTLFKTAGTAAASVAEVIERLRARLGVDAVHGLRSVADYRPECASRIAPEGRGDAPAPAAPRPFWLLAEPRALAEQDGRPRMRQGPLRLLGSAERIESGWWDAGEAGAVGDVRRDYFVAQAMTGEILWIYRDRAGWWLHGLFG